MKKGALVWIILGMILVSNTLAQTAQEIQIGDTPFLEMYLYSWGKGEETKINLDEYFSVKIKSIDYYVSSSGSKRYRIEYVFSLNPNFMTIAYENNKVIVKNNYQEFDGGLIITKTDIVDTTIVSSQLESLNIGENSFDIDTTNLRELKVRPFIIIPIEDYTYIFDVGEALIVDLTGQIPEVKTSSTQTTPLTPDETEVLDDIKEEVNKDYELYIALGVIVLLGGLFKDFVV